MPAKITWILLVIFLLNSPFLNGQQSFYSKNYTTDHGLPHNHVRSLAQDSTGFLWIATWDGLSRYDGYEFRNYYHNPADSTSLGYFICEKVLVDFQNNVWVFGPSTISKYNRETDNFSRFNFNLVGNISLDKSGKIWCSTMEGIKFWDYEEKCFQPFEFEADANLKKSMQMHPVGLGFDNINALFLYAAVNQNLTIYKITGDNKKAAVFLGEIDNGNMPNIINLSWDIGFYTSSADEIFVLGNLYFLKLDTLRGKFLPVKPFGNQIFDVELVKLRQRQLNYSTRLLSDEMYRKLNPLTVEAYLIDNQNTLWQAFLAEGANQTGLTRTISTPKFFKHYFTTLNPAVGLNAFFPVMKDKHGNIWAGPANVNKLFIYKPDGTESTIKPVTDETWKLASQRPRAFFEDSTGFWVGYFHRLLLRYDEKSNSFKTEIVNKADSENHTLPFSFLHLKKNADELLITGYKELNAYNPVTKKVTFKKPVEIDEKYNFFSIAKDIDNSYWLGASQRMLFHLDSVFQLIASYEVTPDLYNIEDVIIGDNSDLWLSLLGGGLAHFDKATGKTIKVYTTADGLSNNTCYGMLKDKKGNLWISTNKGISKFNPKTERFTTFGKMEGLEIEEFNSDNTFLAPDGEMFFAGMGGVVSFYPDSVEEMLSPEYQSHLVLTDFKVSGSNRFFNKALYDCDTIRLNKGDDNFQLSFACLDFRNSEKIKYRYRLLPGEKEFLQTGFRHRTLNYASLLPGTYRLEVEATNESGEWSTSKVLIIRIPAYFYQTIWFKLLLLISIAGIISFMIFSYNHRLRLQARQKQDEMKLESLRSQMNPHFIFNALNSVNFFISQNDRLSANRYIADFSRLIRSFLGNLSHEFIPLSKELKTLNNYLQLEHLRFSDKFDYELIEPTNLQMDEVFIFPGMVQPFIENAIWHGLRGLSDRKGKVKVDFILGNDGELKCQITDDGIGRKLAEQRKSSLPGKTSRGIGIVLERLKIANHLYRKNYQVEITDLYPDAEESGTRVVVDIPLKMS